MALAESMGILPTIPLQVVDFSALALPAPLEDSVERSSTGRSNSGPI